MPSARTEDTRWLGTVEDDLVGLLGRKRYVRVGGVHGAGLGLLVAGLARRFPAVLVVTGDARLAEAVALDAETFSGRPALRLLTWPSDPAGTPDADVLAARVQVLTTLRAARAGAGGGSPRPTAPRTAAPVVVAPVAALVQDVPPRSAVEGAMLVLEEGKEHSLPSLLEHLALSGYVRVAAVESPGEFASRGGVLDLFPFGSPSPARVDFFGDTIESISAFDPATGRLGARAARLEALCLSPDRVRDPAPAWGPALATDHLPDEGLVVVVEPASVAAKVATAKAEARGTDRLRLRRADQALAARRRLDLASLRLSTDGDLDVGTGALDDLRGLAARAEAGRARRGASSKGAEARPASPEAVLVEAFRRLAARADRVVVWRRALGEEERLVELLAPGSQPAAGSRTAGSPIDVAGVPVTFAEGSLSASFVWPPTRTAHVAYDDLADLSVRERRPAPSLPPSRPIQDFLELEPGEPVVHLHHGIGIFRGLVAGDPKREPGQFLAIEFEGGTTMHVPVARIDLVQRYIGTGRRPKLSRLGGAEWGARKQKVAAAVAEFAEELLTVQAMRGERRGDPLRPHPEWQKEFEDAFPWRDTPDQGAATEAIKKDFLSARPMDRLLCGDVGYGKTEVALRAAFLAATNGRQVAVLVPTTVLAEQHVRTFAARLAAYPIVVRALSRFRTPAEQREILAGLADGSVDVVVGTHRLLSKDVVFADLGLVVVDEEQRFGVQHKERLKALRADVDVLTLSATPIPRTLHMALLGLRDISNLTTPPPGRQPIETRLARTDDALVREAVRGELDRGGQVFFVHNKVLDLHLIAGMVMRLVPEARTATVHGQMDKDAVEERMLGFVRGDVDVLVTTTIVESGLDIPNANTMIVHNADRFGLAELHQLRGRVGREQRHAHCLLLIDKDRALSEEAAHRLRALEEYSELGAGFRIAMRDLELRGAGNLLGAQQSGHIASVGYDLYCRLLADAVRAATKDLPAPSPLAALDVELPCGVPTSYVKDPRETFRIFRRVASATTLDLLSELRAEVEGRFGPPPPDTKRLFLHQAVRILAGALGIARVAPAEAGGLVLEAHDPRALDRLEADPIPLSAKGGPLRRLEPRRAYFPPPPSAPAGDVPRALAATVERLEAALSARVPHSPGAPRPPDAHAAFPGPRPHE